MTKKTAKRWSKFDDAKLKILFQDGELDPSKMDSKSITDAMVHFPGRPYASFAATYKRKCTAFNLEKDLAGKPMGGKREGSGRKRKQLTIADNLMLHNRTNLAKRSPVPHPLPLNNKMDYDVVIVGAGVAGCSAAYHLMMLQEQQGYSLRILVVDSGLAPGEGVAPQTRSGTATMEAAPCVKMMVQLFAGSYDGFARHHGAVGAKRYLDATRRGLVIQKSIAGELWNNDKERRRHLKELGSYYVGSTEQDEVELKREFEILSSLVNDDDGIEWCNADRLSSVEGMSSDFRCGIYFPKDAVIDSSGYAKTLMEYVVKRSEGNIEFWPNATVRSIDSQAGGEFVCIQTDDNESRSIVAKKVVVATGAICRSRHQNMNLSGLIKPCYSYLVHVPVAFGVHGCHDDNDYCSPNFFTWGYTHDWCFTTKGKVRVSGEDHFSAYKSPKAEERCKRLSRWTLDRYDSGNAYSDEEISSFPSQYGLYSETVDMVPLVGTFAQEEKEQNICYLLGCNAWGQTILSYCASLVPGLLGYQELTGSQRDVLNLVSIRRFSHNTM